MESKLLPGERIDEIGFGGLKLIQKPEEFCYGIDAVLLADFAKIKKGGTAVDLGTGTAVIPLILSRKTEADRIVGVEIQKDAFDRAQRSVSMNALSDRIKLLHVDVKDLLNLLEPESFDVVVSNPPYNEKGGAIENNCPAQKIARHETTAKLEDFIRAAERLLKDRGEFCLVHRPSRLVDIIFYCRKYRLEPKEICFVHPRQGRPANIVLLRCVKNGGPELRFLEPLFVYESDGEYTNEIKKIYQKET